LVQLTIYKTGDPWTGLL